MIKILSIMSKRKLWAIVAIDKYLSRILARKACLSRAEAAFFKAKWETEYNGYYVEFFKY